jgi:hypothetical protein
LTFKLQRKGIVRASTVRLKEDADVDALLEFYSSKIKPVYRGVAGFRGAHLLMEADNKARSSCQFISFSSRARRSDLRSSWRLFSSFTLVHVVLLLSCVQDVTATTYTVWNDDQAMAKIAMLPAYRQTMLEFAEQFVAEQLELKTFSMLDTIDADAAGADKG